MLRVSNLFSTSLFALALTSATAAFADATPDCNNGSGLQTTECGTNSVAGSNYSTAVGDTSVASGANSTAIGEDSTASGSSSIAVGSHSTASGDGATAVGLFSFGVGDNSSAFGGGSQANGDYSTALGVGSNASGRDSVALGSGSVATDSLTVSVGNGSSDLYRQITNVADGTAAHDAATVGQVQAADAVLQTNIDSVNARVDDVQGVNVAQQAEIDAFGAGEANQNAAINDLSQDYGTVSSDLATEQSQRIAAETALSNRIGAVEGAVASINSRLDDIDKKIASSTAVATALSGNAFLPDMKFNLTANLATYNGAKAGAIQMGALLSRHAAVNAGVATAFNKGGQTAGRVGFTFGW